MIFLWDAFEFYRQHYRIQSGHAPANPDNPRHARILAGISSAAFVLSICSSMRSLHARCCTNFFDASLLSMRSLHASLLSMRSLHASQQFASEASKSASSCIL